MIGIKIIVTQCPGPTGQSSYVVKLSDVKWAGAWLTFSMSGKIHIGDPMSRCGDGRPGLFAPKKASISDLIVLSCHLVSSKCSNCSSGLRRPSLCYGSLRASLPGILFITIIFSDLPSSPDSQQWTDSELSPGPSRMLSTLERQQSYCSTLFDILSLYICGDLM